MGHGERKAMMKSTWGEAETERNMGKVGMKRNVSKNGNEKHLGKEKKKVLEKLYWNVQLLGEYALGCGRE